MTYFALYPNYKRSDCVAAVTDASIFQNLLS